MIHGVQFGFWLLVAFDNNYFNFPARSAAGKLVRPRTSKPHDCEFLKFNVMRLKDLRVLLQNLLEVIVDCLTV